MKPSVAFDVCHEVYVTAREIVNSRMSTLQMDRASKFLWRPDLKPRLVEYVADFALAGSRAPGSLAGCFGHPLDTGRIPETIDRDAGDSVRRATPNCEVRDRR